MKNFFLLTITALHLIPPPSQSDTNHFGAGGVFELDLSDSEILMTPKQERTKAFRRTNKEEKRAITRSLNFL